VPGEPRLAIQRLPQRIKPRNGNRQRPFPLRLVDDLIDALADGAIMTDRLLAGGQEGNRRSAARYPFLDFVGRAKFQAIDPVPMQTRQVDLVVARDLRRRLAGSKPAVDLGALQMLAGFAGSRTQQYTGSA
jgi:hypothetical protein